MNIKSISGSEVKVLGVNQDQTSCDCCGKTNLKRVVWLEIDGGEAVGYGVDCAAKALYGRRKADKYDVLNFHRAGITPVTRVMKACVQPPSLCKMGLWA